MCAGSEEVKRYWGSGRGRGGKEGEVQVGEGWGANGDGFRPGVHGG